MHITKINNIIEDFSVIQKAAILEAHRDNALYVVGVRYSEFRITYSQRGLGEKKSKLLLIGGHEGIGRLVAIGVNLEYVGVGDRVAFKWFVTCVDSVSFFQLWIFVLCPIYISGVKCVAKDTSRVCLLTYFPMFFKLSLMHIFIMDK